MRDKQEIESEIGEIEARMQAPDFWADKDAAQAAVRRHQELKDELGGVGKYDRGPAVMTIFAGAGGLDAEDFARILFNMYTKYAGRVGYTLSIIHQNENDHGGYRNITFELSGRSDAYGRLKKEAGVHRLVRISPFSAKKQRHTSFVMVEVIPKFEKLGHIEIHEKDIRIELSKSGGPGGQNVNKRETAVRIVHEPTGIAVTADNERSQVANKERALALLEAKLYRLLEEQRREKIEDLHISKTTSAEWGNQIRSYVVHPYQMVKDHRTDVEVRDADRVFDGDIDVFLDAESGGSMEQYV